MSSAEILSNHVKRFLPLLPPISLNHSGKSQELPISVDGLLKYFPKIGFDISYKLSPVETICMKCQILFSGKIRKNIFNLLSAELAKRVVKVLDGKSFRCSTLVSG